MEQQKIRESKSAKAGLAFPVARFQSNLRKGHYAEHIGTAGAVYLTGVLEYLTAEILELAGNAAREHNKRRIVPRHIMLAIKNDVELSQLLNGAFFADSGVMPNLHPMLISNSNKQKAAQKVPETGAVNASSENF